MNWLARFIIQAHGIITRSRNTPRIAKKQAEYVSEMADSVILEAAENESSPGHILFLRLPDEAANEVIKHYFDPFHLRLNRESVRYWLESHILFSEDGRIVVMHDYGTIYWIAPNTNLKGLLNG